MRGQGASHCSSSFKWLSKFAASIFMFFWLSVPKDLHSLVLAARVAVAFWQRRASLSQPICKSCRLSHRASPLLELYLMPWFLAVLFVWGTCFWSMCAIYRKNIITSLSDKAWQRVWVMFCGGHGKISQHIHEIFCWIISCSFLLQICCVCCWVLCLPRMCVRILV
jgi:hypothetical protein